MKNKDLMKFQEGLNSVSELKGVKFAFAVAKNIKAVNSALEDVRAAYKQDPKFQEYDTARVELAKTYSEKGEDGNPKVINNQFIISNVEEFNTALADLQIEYADCIREHMNTEEEFNELLEQEADLTLNKVNSNLLPEDLTAKQIDAIFEMISEED